MSTSENIAKILGGAGSIRLMTGCKVYSNAENTGLILKGLKRSKFQSVEISYNRGTDLFDVRLIKVRKMLAVSEEFVHNVYVDVLKSVVENKTGLYLSL